MRCSACLFAVEQDALFCGQCGRRTRVRRESRTGTVIDGAYRIEAPIASGGFGSVYRATYLPSGTPVALKILHADLADDPRLRGRFAREGRALAKLRSRHTVVTFHRGESPDGALYIVMELLEGESLRERLQRVGCMPWRDALAIVRDICRSLAEAHACGIVHRDLKPANVHVGIDGIIRVLDFGIAKVMPWSGIDDLELTAVGETVGTLEYMAPELMLGGDCDARTDIYSLGLLAYELLTGKLPFSECTSAAALVTATLTQAPPPVSASCVVPAGIDRLVARCLESDPAQRFTTVVELAAAIDRIVHGGSVRIEMTPIRAGET